MPPPWRGCRCRPELESPLGSLEDSNPTDLRTACYPQPHSYTPAQRFPWRMVSMSHCHMLLTSVSGSRCLKPKIMGISCFNHWTTEAIFPYDKKRRPFFLRIWSSAGLWCGTKDYTILHRKNKNIVGIVPGWGNFNLLLLQTAIGRYLRNTRPGGRTHMHKPAFHTCSIGHNKQLLLTVLLSEMPSFKLLKLSKSFLAWDISIWKLP